MCEQAEGIYSWITGVSHLWTCAWEATEGLALFLPGLLLTPECSICESGFSYMLMIWVFLYMYRML